MPCTSGTHPQKRDMKLLSSQTAANLSRTIFWNKSGPRDTGWLVMSEEHSTITNQRGWGDIQLGVVHK